MTTEPVEHQPTKVTSVEGMYFVRCSCRSDMSPISRIWLLEHWQGSVEDGVAAIKTVAERQRLEAAR